MEARRTELLSPANSVVGGKGAANDPSFDGAPARKPLEEGQALCVVLDGTRVPARPSETAGRRGRDGGQATTREAKVGAAWLAELDGEGGLRNMPDTARYFAAVESGCATNCWSVTTAGSGCRRRWRGNVKTGSRTLGGLTTKPREGDPPWRQGLSRSRKRNASAKRRMWSCAGSWCLRRVRAVGTGAVRTGFEGCGAAGPAAALGGVGGDAAGAGAGGREAARRPARARRTAAGRSCSGSRRRGWRLCWGVCG